MGGHDHSWGDMASHPEDVLPIFSQLLSSASLRLCVRFHFGIQVDEIFCYVLQSKSTGSLYIGSSAAPDQRLASHNAGRVRSTKSARPWIRVHLEDFEDRQTAEKRERYLKSGYGRRWLLRHLNLEGW